MFFVAWILLSYSYFLDSFFKYLYILYIKNMWIKITKEKTWYSAYIPEYRIHTQWETFEELIENLKEAVNLFFSKDKK